MNEVGGTCNDYEKVGTPIIKSASFINVEPGYEWSHLADLSHDLESYECPFDLSHCSD